MSKTIVQEYGPIYGEPVNGTVQGRPNGSVYVPITNTISVSLDEDHRYFIITVLGLRTSDHGVADSVGYLTVAQSQDLSSNIQIQVYSDGELTDLVSYRDFPAGLFNVSAKDIYNATTTGLTDEQTVYLRAQLMNNGVAVATSDVIECEMVIP